MQDQINQLTQSFNSLLAAFKSHVHNGTDSQLLPSSTTTASNQTTYAGAITSSGTSTFLPSGWTVAHTTTGVYTVTHNLGNANYGIVGNSLGTFGYANICSPTSTPGTNSFVMTVGTIGVGGSVSPTDNPFNFILSLN